MHNSWTVTTIEDPETGDLILPLPDDLIELLGWQIDDILSYDMLPGGAVSITNLTHTERNK